MVKHSLNPPICFSFAFYKISEPLLALHSINKQDLRDLDRGIWRLPSCKHRMHQLLLISWIHLTRKKPRLTLPNPPIYIWFSLCETCEQPLDIEMFQIKVRKSQDLCCQFQLLSSHTSVAIRSPRIQCCPYRSLRSLQNLTIDDGCHQNDNPP